MRIKQKNFSDKIYLVAITTDDERTISAITVDDAETADSVAGVIRALMIHAGLTEQNQAYQPMLIPYSELCDSLAIFLGQKSFDPNSKLFKFNADELTDATKTA